MSPPFGAVSNSIFEVGDSLLFFFYTIISSEDSIYTKCFLIFSACILLVLAFPFFILSVYVLDFWNARRARRMREYEEEVKEIRERRHHDHEKNRKLNETDETHEPTARKRDGSHTGSASSLAVGLDSRVQKNGDEENPCTADSLSNTNHQARNLSCNDIPAIDIGDDFSADDVEDDVSISIVEHENEQQPYAFAPLPNRNWQQGRQLAPYQVDKPSAPLTEDTMHQWQSIGRASTDALDSPTRMGSHVYTERAEHTDKEVNIATFGGVAPLDLFNFDIDCVSSNSAASFPWNDHMTGSVGPAATASINESPYIGDSYETSPIFQDDGDMSSQTWFSLFSEEEKSAATANPLQRTVSNIFSTESEQYSEWTRPSSISLGWANQNPTICISDSRTIWNWLDGMSATDGVRFAASRRLTRRRDVLRALRSLKSSSAIQFYILSLMYEPEWFTNTQERPGRCSRWHWPVSWYDYKSFRKSCEEAIDTGSEKRVAQDISNSNRWDTIEKNVFLIPDLHQASSFELGGEVFHFINDQLDGNPEKLRSLFVVVGTEDRAWASTCLEYVRIMWPWSGEQFLEGLIALICDIMASEKQYIYHCKLSQNLNFRVYTNGSTRTLRFYGYGPGHEMINIMRQLAWISSICRIPQEDRLLLSRTCVQWSGLQRQFVIKAEPLQLASKASASCWHSMFAGYILAHEFPIPAREFGLGVEMPFDIMTILGLICYPINYGAGILLKGDSTALIPSKESNDPNSIQWHFVCDGSMESTLSWDMITRRCNPEDVFCARDWKTLAGKRAFVGYFPKAEVHLGTDNSGFENVKSSGAPIDDKKRFNFVQELTSSFGTSGLGILGGGLSGKVVFHRLSENRIRGAHGMFRNKLQNAKQQPLLLFDTTTRRGWLVPELSCVLHLSLSWASYEDDPGVLAAFHRAEISTDGGSAAYLAIQRAGTNTLPGVEDEENFDKEIEVRGIVKRFMERLGQIKEQQQQLAHCTGTITDSLTGYEYVDVAQFQEHLAAKRVQLDGHSTGDWLKVMQKWPEIPVLLCSNLGDPIRPASSEAPCHHWKSVPEGSCFMTAAGSCIKYISQRAGGQGSLNIFNKLHCTSAWASRPSAPCLNASWPCCSPLFEVGSNDNLGSFKLEDDAAIIFGKPTKELCRRFTAANMPAVAKTYDKYRARMYFHRSSADVESTCQESTITPGPPVQL